MCSRMGRKDRGPSDSHWAVGGSRDVWRIGRGEGKGADHEGGKTRGKTRLWQCTDLLGDKARLGLAVTHSGRNAQSW